MRLSSVFGHMLSIHSLSSLHTSKFCDWKICKFLLEAFKRPLCLLLLQNEQQLELKKEIKQDGLEIKGEKG